MLQKLRVKFFLLAMSILFLVLAVVVGAANLSNYQSVLESSDYTLKILISNGGSFPNKPNEEGKPRDWQMSPERPYETRYFSVRFNTDGSLASVDVKKIAAIDSALATDYAKQVLASSRLSGFIGDYRYAVKTDTDGSGIVFLDCGRQLSSADSFLWRSILVSFAGLLVVGILLYVLSARVVKPIAESYEKQRQFITNAGHDLRTPITIIDADLEILEMDHGENEWIDDIKKQTKRLAELIHELIYLSRMDEKGNRLHMIDFPFSDVVSETAQSFEAPALTQGKSFSMQVQPMLSFCGDENALRRVVTVLLDNAVKYSDSEGKIALTLTKSEHSLVLTVYNTCAPIAEGEIRHLFDRFYRGDQSRNAQNGGYGIGLSIAKSIVDAHKGSIRATTTDGHSMTVTATFPVK